MKDFNDKTVIITGASAGVGAACARTFAGLGAKLVLVARGQQALSEIENELCKTTQVLAVAMDVSDIAACTDLIQLSRERFGAIHVLVNNAGLHRRGEVESKAPQDLVDMVNVDLRAPLQLTAEVLPHIRKAGTGAVAYGLLPTHSLMSYAIPVYRLG